MGDCEGCLVGLFDPAVSAAAADSLAGPMMGAAPRARRRHRWAGEVTRTRLMVEDGAASPALRDGGDAAYADLCECCSAAYADRVAESGCAACGERLALGMGVIPGIEYFCAPCAVEHAVERRAAQ